MTLLPLKTYLFDAMGFFLTVPGLLLVALAGFLIFGTMGLLDRRR